VALTGHTPPPAPSADQWRDHLNAALQTASRDYDQAILTLSAGILAVSVTFAHDLTPQPVPGSPPFLFAGWLLLLVAVTCTLFSFATSQRAIRKMIRAANSASAKNLGTATTQTQVKPGRGLTRLRARVNAGAAKVTGYLNAAAGIFFVFGVLLLVLYASFNLGTTLAPQPSPSPTAPPTAPAATGQPTPSPSPTTAATSSPTP
jgi:hypothetical protein